MDLRAILMGLGFALLWSSAFTSARIIVTEAPALTSLSLRFLISGLIGVAIARAMGESWQLSRAQWRTILIFGICQNALYLGLYWLAMQWVDAGLAAIIAATMPLVVAGLGRALYGDRISPLGLAGLAAGFAGVALIMGARLGTGASGLGVLLCAGGVIALAVATLALRGIAGGGNVMMVVGLQMLVGALALAPFTLLESWQVTLSPRLVLSFLYTVLAPGLLATWIWMKLVARIGTTRAATFHFLNPVFGVAIAALLLGESFGPLDMLGVVITTLGILAVQLSRQK